MKKFGVLVVFLFLLLFSIISVSAQANSSSSVDSKALACINDNIDSKGCASLTNEELAFTSLVSDECRDELRDREINNQCWPVSTSSTTGSSDGCDLRTTAVSGLALNSGSAKDWVSTKMVSPSEITWYLQVDISDSSNVSSSCTTSYDGKSYTFKVLTDKTLDSNAGSCLRRARSNYWFEVDNSCNNKLLTVSCDQDFTTSTLYSKRGDSSKYFLSSDTKSSSASGKTEVTIDSYCLSSNGRACSYEGTLWGVLLLDKRKVDTTPFIPYLIAFADDYERLGSYAFLYSLTGFNDYYSLLSASQKDSGYYDFSSSYKRYYDTAVALLSLNSYSTSESSNAKDWLSEVQGTDGCWGNLRDTSFLLYSSWPVVTSSTSGSVSLCSSEGYYCLANADCQDIGGDVFEDFTCSGVSVCCSKNIELESCGSQGGLICSSGQTCEGSIVPSTNAGQCCVDGLCIDIPDNTPQISECESYNGACKSGCFSDEEKKDYSCNTPFDVCCMKSSTPVSSGSLWWLWLLLIIGIIIVVLLIVFRKKLFKKKFGGSSDVRTSRPPFPPQRPMFRPMTRPMSRPMPSRPSNVSRSPARDKELDDTLKKLREISK